MMELIIVGSGTCVPRTRRGGPANLVRITGADRSMGPKMDFNILVDSASGTLRQLLGIGIEYHELDLILYTHFHPDHISELVPYLFATRYAPGFKRITPAAIMASEGLFELMKGLKGAFGHWVEPDPDKVVMEEIPRHMEARIQLPPIELSCLPLEHTQHSLAYRITDHKGRSIVFSGDTDFDERLGAFARGVNILVLECARPEGRKVEGHLTPSEAGRIAALAEPGLLVLTHFYPDCDDTDLLTPLREEYTGAVVLAEDFTRIPII